MAINKVVYDGTTLIDLTEDTVTADTLLQGVTAHDKSGNIITGTLDMTDYIIEDEVRGNWKYRKWNSGRIEAWYHKDLNTQYTFSRASSSSYYYTNSSWVNFQINLPSGLFSAVENAICNISTNGYISASVSSATATAVSLRAYANYGASATFRDVSIYVVGS